jgi:tRNA uridine 5-carboxymethylaminomethyl modification enzyme
VGPPREPLAPDEAEQVEIRARYAGYIERQLRERERRRELAAYRLPPEIDYRRVHNLSREAVEKLSRRRPANLAEAARIPGLRESELTALLVHLVRQGVVRR